MKTKDETGEAILAILNSNSFRAEKIIKELELNQEFTELNITYYFCLNNQPIHKDIQTIVEVLKYNKTLRKLFLSGVVEENEAQIQADEDIFSDTINEAMKRSLAGNESTANSNNLSME
jgi:hypothetical protein